GHRNPAPGRSVVEPLRRAVAGRRRQRTGRARPRHQCRPHFHGHVRGGIGSGRPRGHARSRVPRARPQLSAEVPGLFSDRGDGRRDELAHRAVSRRDHPRHRRCRREILPARDRTLHHLRGDGRDPDRAALRAGGAERGAMSAAVEAGFAHFRRRAAWRPLEYAFWIAVVASLLVFPRRLSFINEVAILGLFVLSLDLILGFAGIVSLGHVAFFGVGAYAAALFGLAVFADPLVGVLVGGATAALVGFASSFLILRGSDLTRLMITLGVASLLYELANRLSWTGGANGL